MFPRARRKMYYWPILYITSVILDAETVLAAPKASTDSETSTEALSKEQHLESNIIDSETEYEIKFNSKYGIDPSWHIGDTFNKNSHKYTMIKQLDEKMSPVNVTRAMNDPKTNFTVNETDTSKLKHAISNVTGKSDVDLVQVMNESDSMLVLPILRIINSQNSSTANSNSKTESSISIETTTKSFIEQINETSSQISKFVTLIPALSDELSTTSITNLNKSSEKEMVQNATLKYLNISIENFADDPLESHNYTEKRSDKQENLNKTEATTEFIIEINDRTEGPSEDTEIDDDDVPIYTELDYETDVEVPEDYYDGKDLVPTPAPSTDALSVIAGLAGSVAETVAERILPKGIFDLYKRMQKQNEAIEAERLRSREENGGLGQFGRGILKSLSSGLTPLSQLMAGARDIGSLDSNRGFVGGLASGVVGVADSVATVASTLTDAFKDRVQAIFPGTLWCGDGHAAAARANELGLFFLTDTCCRQHDACKLFIRAGDTRHGLTNTGLFTRSHCSCDNNFLNCLRKTNSLVSSQIGITYFNVLGPQCFRKTHPIVRCVRRTRITGQKCEEYELDYGKPKMWQWFDSETF